MDGDTGPRTPEAVPPKDARRIFAAPRPPEAPQPEPEPDPEPDDSGLARQDSKPHPENTKIERGANPGGFVSYLDRPYLCSASPSVPPAPSDLPPSDTPACLLRTCAPREESTSLTWSCTCAACRRRSGGRSLRGSRSLFSLRRRATAPASSTTVRDFREPPRTRLTLVLADPFAER